MKKRTERLIMIIFCLFAVICLLLLSYKIILSSINLSQNQEFTFDYLLQNRPLLLNYTELELSHLQDVQRVMTFVNYLFYLSLLICTIIITATIKNKILRQRLFFWGGFSTIIVVILILICSLVGFNSTFTIFHEIFFPQGNWIFPSDSLLIETFPLEFFENIVRNIFLLALMEGIIFILLSIYFKHENRNKES